MKKVLIGLIILLSLSIIVGCTDKKPTDEEMKEYQQAHAYYTGIVVDSLKWKDEIYNNIHSDMNESEYEGIMNVINENKEHVDKINLKEIEKYFKFKEYSNPDKEVVKKVRKEDAKEVKVKTEKLKENINLYKEMAELENNKSISDEDRINKKAELFTKININQKIITSIGLPDKVDELE